MKITCVYCGKEYSKSGIKSHQKWCKGSIESKSTSVEGSERVEIESKSSRFEDDPEYDLLLVREGVWECEKCGTYYDAPENRCLKCNARFV